MKNLLITLSFFYLLISCGVPQSEHEKLQRECKELRSEISKYKERYGEIPVLNKEEKVFGIWEVRFYVDDFGESTGEGYATTDVLGTFSNSATTNSSLGVRFLIDKKNSQIQLYEYNRNHPIKGEGILTFKAKNDKGDVFEFKTYNNATGGNIVCNMKFDYEDQGFRDFLFNSKEVKFIGTVGRSNVYKFTLQNADFLSDALSAI